MLKGYFTRKDTRWGFYKEDLKITLVTYAVIAAGYYVWTKIEEKKTNEMHEQEVTEAEFETKEWGDTL